MARPRRLRGPELVHSLFAEQPPGRGLSPAKIHELAFEGGLPLSPSLVAALEHDGKRATVSKTLVKTSTFAAWLEETLPDWAPMITRHWRRIFTARCMPLASGAAADGTGRVTIISRENGRAFAGLEFTLRRKSVRFELLDMSKFDQRSEAPELDRFKPSSSASRSAR